MKLIDADELMKRVLNIITESSGALDWINLINSMPEETVAQTKWIPVTEKLPECEDEEVLVQCNGKDGSIRLIDAFVLATYDKDFGWYSMGRPDLEATVTAWMPLPEIYRPDEKEKITTAADWKGHYMGRFEKVN